MRCREAKSWLGAQRDESLGSDPVAQSVQEHLRQCRSCKAFEQQQRMLDGIIVQSFQKIPQATSPLKESRLSTEQIMRAVQEQRTITKQLETIRQQQQARIEQMRRVGAAIAALGLVTLSSIPLLFLMIIIMQSTFALQTLTLFNGAIDVIIIVGQYVQIGLTLVTRDNWLLSGIAFVVVVMMGMWLRLMRPPQEA